MAIEPQTELYLLKCPLTLSNKNQITFVSKQDQEDYFLSLPKLEIENISYQRKNGIISYPAHIDSILEYNYCMYKNNNYSDKWFFAYITDMIYENDNCTYIQITTDVYQTWQFDLIFKQSFVEREMVNVADDVMGKNLIDEHLELGEIVVNSSISDTHLDPYFVIAYSGDYIEYNNQRTNIPQSGAIINGIPSAIAYLICGGALSYGAMIEIINDCGMGDKIFTCFTIPKCAFEDYYDAYTMNITIDTNLPCCIVSDGSYPNGEKELTFNKNTTLDTYSPRNKKLLNYPYNYIGFTALNGDKKIFKFENFSGNPTFQLLSELNPNPTIMYRPLNYRNSQNGLNDVVAITGYPTLAYKNDYYNTWLAQNSNIIKLAMIQEETNYEAGLTGQITDAINGAIDIGSGAGTSKNNTEGKINRNVNLAQGLIGSVSTGVSIGATVVNHEIYVKQQLAQKQKQKLLPDTVNIGSTATLIGYNLFSTNVFSIFTIKKEFAERIDKYFDMYGYQTNLIKIPNLNNRPNWNYIKTDGANILGNIPQSDLQIIKDLFDNGITLWHNTTNFLNYSVNNR